MANRELCRLIKETRKFAWSYKALLVKFAFGFHVHRRA